MLKNPFLTQGSHQNFQKQASSYSCFWREIFLFCIPVAQLVLIYLFLLQGDIDIYNVTSTFFHCPICDQLLEQCTCREQVCFVSKLRSPWWRCSWLIFCRSHASLPWLVHLGPGNYSDSWSLNINIILELSNKRIANHMWLFKFRLIKITWN